MARHKNVDWNLPTPIQSADHAALCVLMDIRDELQAVQIALLPLRHLNCPNFLQIPAKLDRLVKQTHRPRRRKRTA